MRRIEGLLSIGVPEGWLAGETVELFSPGASSRIVAWTGPVPSGMDETRYAEESQARLSSQAAGYRELGTQPSAFLGGHRAFRTHFEWCGEDGRMYTGIHLYQIRDGWGLVVSASTPSDRFGAAEADILDVMSGLRVAWAPGPSESTAPRINAGRTDRSLQYEAGLLSASIADSEEPSHGAMPDLVSDYGAEELLAAAKLIGLDMFPGIPEIFTNASPDAQKATLLGARRSLLARGAVVLEEGAGVRFAPPHDVLLGTSLRAETIVFVQHQDSHRTEIRLYYAKGELGVEQSVMTGNVYRFAAFPAARVISRIFEFTGTRTVRGQREPLSFRLPVPAWKELLRGAMLGEEIGERDDAAGVPETFRTALTNYSSMSRVRSLYRRGEVVLGGDIAWVDTGRLGLWRLEPVEDTADTGAASFDIVTVSQASTDDVEATLNSYLGDGRANDGAHGQSPPTGKRQQ